MGSEMCIRDSQKIAEAFIEILKDYEAIREEIAWTFEETALDLEHR